MRLAAASHAVQSLITREVTFTVLMTFCTVVCCVYFNRLKSTPYDTVMVASLLMTVLTEASSAQAQVSSPCMQVKKEAKELERQFGTGTQIRLPGKIAAMVRDINGTEVEMATIMIFGDSQKCQQARSLLLEAVDNKEQKQKQRQKVCPCSGASLP
jgi:hypothetical protein